MHETISVSDWNYEKLTEIKAELMKKRKKSVSFNAVISELIRVYESKPRLM